MGAEYTLQQLAERADVTPRTIRYYISQGLLPSPGQVGPGARYTDAHLERLRLIRRLQRAHLPLAEIRAELGLLDERQIATLADSPARPAPGSAVDYVRSVLGEAAPPAHRPAMMASFAPPPVPDAARVPTASTREPARAASVPNPIATPSPDRSQWERISLSPDVELHVRRPLTRHHNRLVDRLVTIARQLFEEDHS